MPLAHHSVRSFRCCPQHVGHLVPRSVERVVTCNLERVGNSLKYRPRVLITVDKRHSRRLNWRGREAKEGRGKRGSGAGAGVINGHGARMWMPSLAALGSSVISSCCKEFSRRTAQHHCLCLFLSAPAGEHEASANSSRHRFLYHHCGPAPQSISFLSLSPPSFKRASLKQQDYAPSPLDA